MFSFSYKVSKVQNYYFFFIRASFMKKTIKNKKEKVISFQFKAHKTISLLCNTIGNLLANDAKMSHATLYNFSCNPTAYLILLSILSI